jgi:hypothetical protein
MGKKSRRPAGTTLLEPAGGEIPVVGGREPCPCGSGKRYKACHGRTARLASAELVRRPFEGLPGECDWVAMREIVPAATASVRTLDGGRDVTVATVLPMAWPALRRADGSVHVGLQTQGGSGDPSRDVAAALLSALDVEPGTPVAEADLPGPGPRLQDVLDPDAGFPVQVHAGFDFWLEGVEDVTPEVRESMERANAAAVPTVRLETVEAAYWCRIGDRRHLRWVLPLAEEEVLDAIARLHAAGASALVEGSRYVGAFRAHGLVVPVWDLAADTEADELQEPAAALLQRLGNAMAVTAPLTVEERRARAGVVSRQLTLR